MAKFWQSWAVAGVSVTLRLPPGAAAAAKPGAHPVHFIIERQASPTAQAHSEREKSTFVIPR